MTEEQKLKLLNEVNYKMQGVAYQHEMNEKKTSIMNLNREQLTILFWAIHEYAESKGFEYDSCNASYYIKELQNENK